MNALSRLSRAPLFGILALLVAAGPVRAADWVEHKSADGGFSARFPSQPKTNVQEVQTAIGAIKMHMIITEQGNSGFTVIYAKFPDQVAQAPAEQILEGAKQGIIGKGIKVKTTKKISLGDHAGLELFGVDGNGMHLRARLYMVKTTMYQILVASKTEQGLTNDDADRFVSSFRLMNTPEKR